MAIFGMNLSILQTCQKISILTSLLNKIADVLMAFAVLAAAEEPKLYFIRLKILGRQGLNPPEYSNLCYRVYRNNIAIATTTNTNYSNSGLNPGTQYCYKITAYIDENQSGYSNISCAQIENEQTTQYPIPQNITAIPISHSQIRVSWDSNPDVLQYKIYFQGDGQEYYIPVENNSKLFYHLRPNTIFTFQVKAKYNGANWSELSNPVQATTLPFDDSNIAINSMTTCKGLIDFKEAINPTNYFNNKDDDIYFIIKLEDNYPYGALYLKFDLYNPSDELNKSFGRIGNYNHDGPDFTTCAQLNGEENNLYHYHGIWKIKIFFGPTIYTTDTYLTTYEFVIKDLSPNRVTGVTIRQIR